MVSVGDVYIHKFNEYKYTVVEICDGHAFFKSNYRSEQVWRCVIDSNGNLGSDIIYICPKTMLKRKLLDSSK